MPGLGNPYSDHQIWAIVAYTRSLAKGGATSEAPFADTVPPPTADQLAMADPTGDPVHRGAAVYFAMGCQTCHGAAGNASGELRLREGGREGTQVIRRGRQGMLAYGPDVLSDAQFSDLVRTSKPSAAGRCLVPTIESTFS